MWTISNGQQNPVVSLHYFPCLYYCSRDHRGRCGGNCRTWLTFTDVHSSGFEWFSEYFHLRTYSLFTQNWSCSMFFRKSLTSKRSGLFVDRKLDVYFPCPHIVTFYLPVTQEHCIPPVPVLWLYIYLPVILGTLVTVALTMSFKLYGWYTPTLHQFQETVKHILANAAGSDG